MATVGLNCPNCSAPVTVNEAYCPACGFDLSVYNLYHQASQPPAAPANPTFKNRKLPNAVGGSLRGEARNVQYRSRSQNRSQPDVLTFRMESFDVAGDRLPPIPVEMSGVIRGVLSEGDMVQIDAKWRPGVTLNPKTIRNLTTGGVIEIQGMRGCQIIVAVFAILFIILFISMILGALLHK